MLIGFLVLAIPLAFFNHLLQAALEQTRSASLGLMREEILQTAEQIRTQMKPATYVKDTVRQIHRKLLPEIVPGMVKMRPDIDFGKEQFSASLPESMLKELRAMGLDAIQIVVAPPSFGSIYYWNSDALKKQCQVEEKLAQDQLVGLHYTSARLYQQHYQKNWPWHNSIPTYLLQAMSITKANTISLISVVFRRFSALTIRLKNILPTIMASSRFSAILITASALSICMAPTW